MVGWEESAWILEVNGKGYTRPDLLAYWMVEREKIRSLKENGRAKPWSLDPVFQRTYFTNVHREDDRITRWIRKNYTPEFFGEHYELAIIAARLFNRIETLEHFKSRWFPVNVSKLTEELREWGNNHKTWGNAYVITTHGMKMSKAYYCAQLLAEASQKLPLLFKMQTVDFCGQYYRGLMEIDGIGSFLSAQIVADLKNTKGHPLSSAPDWYTFSAPGPGSLRGLSWFFHEDITVKKYHQAIRDAWVYLEYSDANDILADCCMQDLQNCMCEFDKYCRVLTGTGRSKRRYPGL